MNPFSERHGHKRIKPVQLNSMDGDLRVDLYNSFYTFFYTPYHTVKPQFAYMRSDYEKYFGFLWVNFLKQKAQNFNGKKFIEFIDYFVHHSEWYRVYDFFEMVCAVCDVKVFEAESFQDYVNHVLKDNNSGYTLHEGRFVPITSAVEIQEIDRLKTIGSQYGLVGVSTHLEESLRLLSAKPEPQLRLSIKESISMVEAVSRLIEPNENTLGKALTKLSSKDKINPLLKAAFEKLYSYTNGENGIRHAIMDEEEQIDLETTRFFLVSCSAFTNYLIEKAIKLKVVHR